MGCRRCKTGTPVSPNRVCDVCKTKCSKCSVTLTPENQDSTSLKHRKNYICKKCVATIVRETRCKVRQKDYDLQRNYGISLEQYEEMFREQSSVCKICHTAKPEEKLAVDHCHDTGKVRGLLCSACNKGLGLFKDNEGYLQSAAKYIKESKD